MAVIKYNVACAHQLDNLLDECASNLVLSSEALDASI